MGRKKKAPERVDPNKIKTRDVLLVRLINGATKSGTHVDRKKREAKYRARTRVRREDDQ